MYAGQAVESAQILQDILKAAADEAGEWHMPLQPPQELAFEQVLPSPRLSFSKRTLYFVPGLPEAYRFTLEMVHTASTPQEAASEQVLWISLSSIKP